MLSFFVGMLRKQNISLDSILLKEKTILHVATRHLLKSIKFTNLFIEPRIAVIQLLVANGADPDIQNTCSQSVFDRMKAYPFLVPYLLTNIERSYLEPLLHNYYSKDFLKQMLSPLIKDETLISVSNQKDDCNLLDYLLEQLKVLKSFYEASVKGEKHCYSKRYYHDLLEILGARICPFTNEYHTELEVFDRCVGGLSNNQKSVLFML